MRVGLNLSFKFCDHISELQNHAFTLLQSTTLCNLFFFLFLYFLLLPHWKNARNKNKNGKNRWKQKWIKEYDFEFQKFL